MAVNLDGGRTTISCKLFDTSLLELTVLLVLGDNAVTRFVCQKSSSKVRETRQQERVGHMGQRIFEQQYEQLQQQLQHVAVRELALLARTTSESSAVRKWNSASCRKCVWGISMHMIICLFAYCSLLTSATYATLDSSAFQAAPVPNQPSLKTLPCSFLGTCSSLVTLLPIQISRTVLLTSLPALATRLRLPGTYSNNCVHCDITKQIHFDLHPMSLPDESLVCQLSH